MAARQTDASPGPTARGAAPRRGQRSGRAHQEFVTPGGRSSRPDRGGTPPGMPRSTQVAGPSAPATALSPFQRDSRPHGSDHRAAAPATGQPETGSMIQAICCQIHGPRSTGPMRTGAAGGRARTHRAFLAATVPCRPTPRAASRPPRVVVIGAGVGGLAAAEAPARRVPVHLARIDRRNRHPFQPLPYRLASVALSTADWVRLTLSGSRTGETPDPTTAS